MLSEIQGWHITIVVMVIGFVINIYVTRARQDKDLEYTGKNMNRHEKNISKLFDDVDCLKSSVVIREQCSDNRQMLTNQISNIHMDLSQRLQKLEGKIDKFIINGRR